LIKYIFAAVLSCKSILDAQQNLIIKQHNEIKDLRSKLVEYYIREIDIDRGKDGGKIQQSYLVKEITKKLYPYPNRGYNYSNPKR